MSLLWGLDDRSGNGGGMSKHPKEALLTTKTYTLAKLTLERMYH